MCVATVRVRGRDLRAGVGGRRAWLGIGAGSCRGCACKQNVGPLTAQRSSREVTDTGPTLTAAAALTCSLQAGRAEDRAALDQLQRAAADEARRRGEGLGDLRGEARQRQVRGRRGRHARLLAPPPPYCQAVTFCTRACIQTSKKPAAAKRAPPHLASRPDPQAELLTDMAKLAAEVEGYRWVGLAVLTYSGGYSRRVPLGMTTDFKHNMLCCASRRRGLSQTLWWPHVPRAARRSEAAAAGVALQTAVSRVHAQLAAEGAEVCARRWSTAPLRACDGVAPRRSRCCTPTGQRSQNTRDCNTAAHLRCALAATGGDCAPGRRRKRARGGGRDRRREGAARGAVGGGQRPAGAGGRRGCRRALLGIRRSHPPRAGIERVH